MHATHPLTRIEALLAPLGIPEPLAAGARTALLQALYGVRTDEAMLDHLANNVRFQAFVGPEAAGWGVAEYRMARERAIAGRDRGALWVTARAVQRAGLWDVPPFAPDGDMLDGWLAGGGITFPDLARLDDAGMQRLLRGADLRYVAIALRDDPTGVRARIEANLSTRMRRILADEIASLGNVRPRDVAQAQAGIAAIARKLMWQDELAAALDRR